jgi:hypothetical protein
LAALFLLTMSSVGLWKLYRGHSSLQQATATSPEQPGADARPGGHAARITLAANLANMPAGQAYLPGPGIGSPPQDHNKSMQQEVAKSLRTEQTSSSLSSLGLQTVTDASGNVLGLRGTVPIAWRQAGVRDTDLISAIDGVAVQRIVATPSAMVRLATQGNVRLTVMRGDRVEVVTVGLRPLTPADRIRQMNTAAR